MDLLHYLPIELVRIIMEFEGTLVVRNGKYMNRIHKSDPRYNILLTIPKPKLTVYDNEIYEYAIEFMGHVYIVTVNIFMNEGLSWTTHHFMNKLQPITQFNDKDMYLKYE